MIDLVKQHPEAAVALISGLALALGGVAGFLMRQAWPRIFGKLYVTRDEQAKCRHEMSQALTKGDLLFDQVVAGQREVAIVLRDLCHALNRLLDQPVNCDRLDHLLTGGKNGR
jgi:hypothetical protein